LAGVGGRWPSQPEHIFYFPSNQRVGRSKPLTLFAHISNFQQKLSFLDERPNTTIRAHLAAEEEVLDSPHPSTLTLPKAGGPQSRMTPVLVLSAFICINLRLEAVFGSLRRTFQSYSPAKPKQNQEKVSPSHRRRALPSPAFLLLPQLSAPQKTPFLRLASSPLRHAITI
jgi:hypothetical protein